MKTTSYVIMWLTMFLVLILAIILALLLLLLAQLYCSPLTRRNRNRQLPPPTATPSTHSPSIHSDPLTDLEKQQLPDPSPEHQNGCLTDSGNGCSLVYICNPIYGGDGINDTPFETPDSSPSRLEVTEDDEVSSKVVVTPPVKDVAGSVGTSGSDTNGVSSSCLLTPSTSPSM